MMQRTISRLATVLASCQALAHATFIPSGSFDYVVVGGGTAGATIATRLAEQSFSVALVEAGTYYEIGSLASIPIADIFPAGSDPKTKSLIDWGFVAKGQPGANHRDIHFARGKCLGGSYDSLLVHYRIPRVISLIELVGLR